MQMFAPGDTRSVFQYIETFAYSLLTRLVIRDENKDEKVLQMLM